MPEQFRPCACAHALLTRLVEEKDALAGCPIRFTGFVDEQEKYHQSTCNDQPMPVCHSYYEFAALDFEQGAQMFLCIMCKAAIWALPETELREIFPALLVHHKQSHSEEEIVLTASLLGCTSQPEEMLTFKSCTACLNAIADKQARLQEFHVGIDSNELCDQVVRSQYRHHAAEHHSKVVA